MTALLLPGGEEPAPPTADGTPEREPLDADVLDLSAGRWRWPATRCCGLAVLAGSAATGAVLLALFAPAGRIAPGVVALLLGLALLTAAAALGPLWTMLPRATRPAPTRALAGRDGTAALLTGLLALPYGFVGGVLLRTPAGGVPGADAAALLLGAGVLLVYTVLAAVAVVDRLPVFVAIASGVLVLALAAAGVLVLRVPPAYAAAVAGAVATGGLPLLPALADRLARIPAPADRPAARGTPDGAGVLARTAAADGQLVALLVAACAVAAGAVPVVLVDGDWLDRSFAALLGLLLLCRARTAERVAHRLPPLVAGLCALCMLLVAVVAVPVDGLSGGVRLTAGLGLLLAIGAGAAGYPLLLAGRRLPGCGRAVDVVEGLLAAAVLPGTLAVCHLYRLIGG